MLHRTNSFSCFQIVSLFRCTITHRFAKWYKITLLSNDTGTLTANIIVLLPYEITLLSNPKKHTVSKIEFYYLMKLHYSQTFALLILSSIGFTTLWNYTTLKQAAVRSYRFCGFTTLWNYTTLKPCAF